MDELVGTLQSYEEERLTDENTRGKKVIALKFNLDSNDSDLEDDEEDDEEITLNMKKLQKMARKGRKFKEKNHSDHLSEKETSME